MTPSTNHFQRCRQQLRLWLLVLASTNKQNEMTAWFDDGPAVPCGSQVRCGLPRGRVHPHAHRSQRVLSDCKSYTNMLGGVSVIHSGPIVASETIQAPTQWTGPGTAAGALQFAQKSTPVIGCRRLSLLLHFMAVFLTLTESK